MADSIVKFKTFVLTPGLTYEILYDANQVSITLLASSPQNLPASSSLPFNIVATDNGSVLNFSNKNSDILKNPPANLIVSS